MTNWQPIEAAPKDGTYIQLWDGDFQHVAKWSSGECGWLVGEVYDGQHDQPLLVCGAIYWKPLDQPPS